MFNFRYFAPRHAVLALLFIALGSPAEPRVLAQSLAERLRAESVEQLVAEARGKGSAVRGAIVFTQPELSCTRCHVPAAEKPIAPDLTRLSDDITDAHLVEALLEPSKRIRKGFEAVALLSTAGQVLTGRIIEENGELVVLQLATGDLNRVSLPRSEIEEIVPSPRSAMPENLVDQLKNRQQFLDLLRYLMELADAQPSPRAVTAAGGQQISRELQGVVLIKDFDCQACHADDVTGATLPAKQPPALLQSVAGIDPHFIQQFISDPLSHRPGTTMPDVMASLPPAERQQAAAELTHFLVSLNQASIQDDRDRGPSVDPAAVERGRELFHTVGCVACHSPRGPKHQELLPATSVPLGDMHDKYRFEGLVAFLEDPLRFRPSGRMPHVQLSHWETIDVASYLLSAGDHDDASDDFQTDLELASLGRTRFTQAGCGHCHAIEGAGRTFRAPKLSEVRSDSGCLSPQAGNWPKFDLSEDQRQTIRLTLDGPRRELGPQAQIELALTAYRCLNCHQRDQLGGVAPERDIYFHTTNPNLGPQGRIPPTLTGVGAKLNPGWLRQVLVGGREIRPYVLTRMPQFGTENVAPLVELFQQTDRLPALGFPEVDDVKLMRETGAELVGTNGLNCIVCHTFQLHEAANMPAVDLTEMAERLQKNWFYHYMRAPQSLSPNTIMPSFWPAGRALRNDILDGNSELQIEALWQYLLDGRQARTPRGLIVEPMELLATDQAVMLRRSYPSVGKRGIGVGYPRQLNLVFDAEQMRLAMLWKGRFADPGGVWRSQGHGQVRPLGDRPLQFASGPDLDHEFQPWIVDDGRPPKHQFSGYALDEAMRPRFKYAFDGIQVEDFVVDHADPVSGQPFLRRSVTFSTSTKRSGLAFRLATGSVIRPEQGAAFCVDDQLHVHVHPLPSTQAGPRIRQTGEVQQLYLPLHLTPGATKITVDYRW